LTPNTSFTRFQVVKIPPDLKRNSPLTQSQKRQIFLAKCEDLGIAPVPQMEKRFYEYIERVIKDRVFMLNENHLGKVSAKVIGKILKTSSSFSQLLMAKNSLGDAGLSILIKYLKLNRSLIHVDFSSNDLKPEGAHSFFKFLKNNENIISVDLGSKDGLNKNKLGTFGAAPLREVLQFNKFLMFLVLPDCQIGSEGLSFIGEGLISNKTLQHLNLANNLLRGRSMRNFFYSLKDSNLVELVLSNNKLGNEGAEAIGDFFLLFYRYSKIRSLSLDSNEIGQIGSNKLLSGLVHNSTMNYLNLKHNPLGETANTGLFYYIDENIAVGYLNLSNCGLRESGCEKVAEGLHKNHTLKTLVLKNNHFKDEGIGFLSEALIINTALLNLDLAKNQITSKGAMVLFTALKKNEWLYSLNLMDNGIKDDAAEFIIEFTRNKGNLQILKLEENLITNRFLDKISKNLEKNRNNYRKNASSNLRRAVRNLSKKDYSTKKIFTQITIREQEKVSIASRLAYHRNNVEEIKRNLKSKYDEILAEARQVNQLYLKVSNEFAGLEYEITLEKRRYENRVNKLELDLRKIDGEIEHFEILCKG
jgi:Ran GTPase-activating protein (RanGAP) involved in mRNA processing and transport